MEEEEYWEEVKKPKATSHHNTQPQASKKPLEKNQSTLM
jgi:hypothetical protein